jgi:hypothetical protein
MISLCILARIELVRQSGAAEDQDNAMQKEKARRMGPPRREKRLGGSEFDFAAQLKEARTVITGDVAEVPVTAIRVYPGP